MSKLADFLKKRQQELAEAIRPLIDQRAKIDTTIQELQKELLDIQQAAKSIGLQATDPNLQLIAQRRSKPPLTIKEAAIEVFRDHPNGLTALDLLQKINRRFDLGIVRSSLSPQLSRLKQAGQIVNEGEIWRLRAAKKEGPTK